MNNDFVFHLKNILEISKKSFSKDLSHKVGIINVKGDEVLAMDKKMEELIINYLKYNNLKVDVFSEEIGYISLCKKATHLVVFDPLDGSTNYQIGQNLLPYGLLIAVYEGLNPKLSDIKASGMFEVTSKRGFIFDGLITKNLEGIPVSIDKKWQIGRKTPAQFDFYYHEAIEKFGTLAQKVHLKWNGSNISSLLYVLCGISSVMGSVKMRPEEIGTDVSLIKGAGGKSVYLSGENIMNSDFGTEKIYPFVAGNKKVVDFIIKELN